MSPLWLHFATQTHISSRVEDHSNTIEDMKSVHFRKSDCFKKSHQGSRLPPPVRPSVRLSQPRRPSPTPSPSSGKESLGAPRRGDDPNDLQSFSQHPLWQGPDHTGPTGAATVSEETYPTKRRHLFSSSLFAARSLSHASKVFRGPCSFRSILLFVPRCTKLFTKKAPGKCGLPDNTRPVSFGCHGRQGSKSPPVLVEITQRPSQSAARKIKAVWSR